MMGSRAAPDSRVELLDMLGELVALATRGQLRELLAAAEHDKRAAELDARERAIVAREVAADQRDLALSSRADHLARQRGEQDTATARLLDLERELDRRATELAQREAALARARENLRAAIGD